MMVRTPWAYLLGLILLSANIAVSADPVDDVAAKIAASMLKKVDRASNNVLVSETDFYDGDSNISLPLALSLKSKVIKALKAKGFNVIEPSDHVSTAWVVQCRWKQKKDKLTVALIANPWKNWKRGTLITRAKVMPKSLFPTASFVPDMDAFSRTLVHRLSLNDRLSQPRSVYLRPLEVNGSIAGNSAHSYFNTWLKNAVQKSNLLLPLDARAVLASTSTSTFRTRGFRPVKKEVVAAPQKTSLTNDLLGSQSELTGNVGLADESIKVMVDLLADDGSKLSNAEVDVPLSSLPTLIAKDLRHVGEMQVSKKVSLSGLDIDISTTRGEGETLYRENEKIQFLLRVNRTAYVYLFDFDSSGQAVALYPNTASDIAVKPVEGGKILVLPDDGLDYEILVSEPFGKDIILAVASDQPLSIPKQLTGNWANAKWLKAKLKALGEASGQGYAEAQVLVVTTP